MPQPTSSARKQQQNRRRPAPVDWEAAAMLLGRGYPMEETARMIGVSRTTLWRALNRSAALGAMVAAQQSETAAETTARIEALRHKVASHIERQVDIGDTRTVLWLARQLTMVGPKAATYADLPVEPALSAADHKRITELAFADQADPPAEKGADVSPTEFPEAAQHLTGGATLQPVTAAAHFPCPPETDRTMFAAASKAAVQRFHQKPRPPKPATARPPAAEAVMPLSLAS